MSKLTFHSTKPKFADNLMATVPHESFKSRVAKQDWLAMLKRNRRKIMIAGGPIAVLTGLASTFAPVFASSNHQDSQTTHQPVATQQSTGQVEAIQGQTYVIQKGDSLSGIAQKYDTDASQIAKDNNISDINQIGSGQKITIDNVGAGYKPLAKEVDAPATGTVVATEVDSSSQGTAVAHQS